jgi:peptidoglycan/xylan/chitin deacetylase (PgdA/CDA1 family)
MTEDQEREMIRDSIESIFKHTNQKCAGYLAPALSHSELTLDLFAEVGTELFGNDAGIYTCDLFHDDQPTPIHLRSKKRFVSIPYSLEMNDTIAYVSNKIEPRRYGQILKDNFDQLYKEGDNSGTVMCIPTHNYQISCPHRMKSYEEALEYITGHSDVWVTTGREIAEYYLEHYYDDAVRDIASKQECKS